MRVALSTRQLWRKLSNGKSLFLIAGPCVIESEGLCLKVARSLRKTCERLGVTYIFKASYDKANRTSGKSRRGPGLEKGLQILKTVREKVNVPVLTDIHDEAQARAAAEVVDVIQIPAFLCRQTDLIEVAAHLCDCKFEKRPIPFATGNGASGEEGRSGWGEDVVCNRPRNDLRLQQSGV